MRDIMGMMGKVKEMQEKMARLQEEIAAMEVAGTSGGGLVTVRLSGKGQMLGLKIDPSLIKDDEVEILEDLDRRRPQRRQGQGRDPGAGKDQGTDRRPADPARHEAALLRCRQPHDDGRPLRDRRACRGDSP